MSCDNKKVNQHIILSCCEHGCQRNIGSNDSKFLCRACRKPLCVSCHTKTIDRTSRDNFYSQYVSYCDACIWFDMG